MLEKMGWTKGKGLGANLDGELNFVRIKHKDDNKGMGFHDRDDQWTQHEQNFNALLKSFETATDEVTGKPSVLDDTFAGDDGDVEAPSCLGFGFESAAAKATAAPLITKESVFSGVSLEEQSKKSSKRVHYKKFTRGKDMARYSEQDLANIFGKKALNDQHKFMPVEAFVADDDDDNVGEKTVVPTEEHVFGVTVIKTGTTVTDYFKAKMEALRLKRQGPSNEGASNPFYVYNPDKVTLNFQPEVAEDNAKVTVTELNDVPVEEVVHKKEKKSKKSKTDNSVQETTANDETENLVTKKTKKSKKTSGEKTDTIEITPIEEDTVTQKKKKPKKSKRSDAKAEEDNCNDQIDFVISKQPQLDNPDDENAEIPNIVSPEVKKSKKRKRTEYEPQQQRSVLTEEPTNVVDAVDGDTIAKSKSKKAKKHKKKTTDDTENMDATTAAVGEGAPPTKKKKSKVISTQPLHFPKFISNVLTSLYDPNVAADDAGDSIELASTVSPTPAPPSVSNTSSPTSNSASASTVLNDTFELAKYKAEVFRFFDLGGFDGSSLADIVGYGYGRNLQLKVVTSFRDDQRITNFWDQALVNKYGANAIQVKKVAKKKKYDVNVLAKKNVFKFNSK